MINESDTNTLEKDDQDQINSNKDIQSFNIEDIQSYNTLTTSDNSERSININLNINFNRLNFKHKKAFLRNFTLRQAIYKPKESNVMI